jgi:hypothetical protein
VKEQDGKRELRIIEEAEGPSEEVLRLKRDSKGDRVETEPVARMPLPATPEAATRLSADAPADEKRSHQPDIDAIIDESDDAPDPEETWNDQKRPVPYGWFVLVAILVALAVAWAVLVNRPEGPTGTALAREVAIEHAEADLRETEDARALVEAVERTLAAYLAADSIEAMLPHVRDPERVAPLMENWYARHEFKPMHFEQLSVFEPVNIGTRSFWRTLARVSAPDGGSLDLEPILVEQTGKDSVRVDWETAVCYQPMPWDDFVTRRPEDTPLDFRVVCKFDRAGLHTYEFQDDTVWRCFLLTAMNSEEYAFGYLRIGSELDKRMYQLFVRNGGRAPSLVLRLRRPEGTRSPRGFVIEDIVSPHWVIVDES